MGKKNVTQTNVFFLEAAKKHAEGNFSEAKALYLKVLSLDPLHIDTKKNLAVLLAQKKKYSAAEKIFLSLIEETPEDSFCNYNLGHLYFELGHHKKALQSLKNAVAIKPDHIEAYNCLGTIQEELGNHEEAVKNFQKVLEFQPENQLANHSLGNLFNSLGQHSDALQAFKALKTYNPKSIIANYNFGITALLLGQFNEGFEGFEFRKKLPDAREHYNKFNSPKPEWSGQDLYHKHLLVFHEQGFGDTIHFVRYILLLGELYKTTITFVVQKTLIHLFANCNFNVIDDSSAFPKHDYQIFLLSLPKIFYNFSKPLPNQRNYLPRNREVSSFWQERLSPLKDFKVGIHWQGNPEYPRDRLRSFPLELFEILLDVGGVDFVSLQRGIGTEQINKFRSKNKLFTELSEKTLESEYQAFENSIGVVGHLDLVITSDTALAHLCATLGKETWVLIPVMPAWRWFTQAQTSPWYSTVRLYRQNRINQWEPVFLDIKRDLVEKLATLEKK